MARCILHIDLDAFFVAVEQVLNPALRGKPVVVGGDPRGRGVVACASYEARAYGLKSGMPLGQAHRLCPHAIFLSGNFHHYRDASEKFMAILSGLTPNIEPIGLEEAYLKPHRLAPLRPCQRSSSASKTPNKKRTGSHRLCRDCDLQGSG